MADTEQPIYLLPDDSKQTTISYQVFAMTNVAADAHKEVARLTHAVPAQEATRRAKQETLRVALVVLALALGAILIYFKPAAGWPIAALMSVLGGTALAPSIIEAAKRLRDTP